MHQAELTEKPIAFFGDIHGHWKFLKEIPTLLPDHYYVFVGDYVDSFTQSVPDQINCLTQVLEWVREGRATALYGNHEMSYWLPDQLCTGYSHAVGALMLPLKCEGLRILQPSLLIDNVLVTHAGLTRELHTRLVQYFPSDLDLDAMIKEEQHNTHGMLYRIGRCRGGRSDYGGIWWCDWSREFQPVPGLHQVFGHSNGTKMPRHFDEETHGNLRMVRFADSRSYNIDSLARGNVWDILTYNQWTFDVQRFVYDHCAETFIRAPY